MENKNSVAYIAKVSNIRPIPEADKIEQCQIGGWNSIIQKGIHKEGDLVLCIITDAVIPQDKAERWKVDKYLGRHNRVKTVKLKGVYSECILIPIFDIIWLEGKFYIEGQDLMEILGIFKYEPPLNTHVSLGTGIKRKHKYHQNPNFHVYYKFPNQKNVPNMFNENDDVIITRKIHGTNARYGIVKKIKLSFLDKIKKFFGNRWVEYEFVYGSHNVEKGSDSQGFYSEDVWKNIAKKYRIKDRLWEFVKYKDSSLQSIGEGVIIYGEIYGPGIQGDKYSYNEKEHCFAGFDIKVNGWYKGLDEREFIFEYLGLPKVQILYEGKWNKQIQDLWVLNSYIGGTKIPHEGIVVSCISGNRDKISKVINPEYKTFEESNNIPDSH